MSARYIVRLDDACPTMHSARWAAVEAILDRYRIRPIVGVIPENLDASQHHSPPDANFWERVRSWEAKGWCIALHGLHHTYHAIPPDCASLVPPHAKSEFVGLSAEVQREKIARAVAVFETARVRPRIFMAPSHTFDRETLAALQAETSIRVLTDGLALQPFSAEGFCWIPQQLWRFRWVPWGVWTVCLHPSTMSESEFAKHSASLDRYASRTISAVTLLDETAPARSWMDHTFAAVYSVALKLKRRR